MREFKDKVAVVTGAASGVGLEICVQLHAAGARVVAADFDGDRLEHETASMAASGADFSAELLDVTDTEALRAFIDGAASKHNGIDYMFNIAGIAGKGGELRDLSPEDWGPIVGVNLMAMIHGSSFAYHHMREQGSGHIVNMASAAGLLGLPSAIPYSTTKSAMVAFSRDLRIEAETFGVKVTVLCPGFIKSRIFENAQDGPVDAQAAKAAIPVKFLDTDRAVATMLKAVLANKPIVTLPGYVDFMWRFRRMFPRSFDRITGRKTIADFRKLRKGD